MPRLVLVVFALIYAVRFAWPALSGSAGAPFGEPWLIDGTGTLLLDSDLRYWGVTSATLSALFLYAAIDVRKSLAWVDLVLSGVLIGGLVRTAEVVLIGVPAPPALIAAGVEWVGPIVWFASTTSLRATRRTSVSESCVVTATPELTWKVFGDYADVGEWHPYMESATLDEGPRSGVGAARTCRFGPNMAIRETVREWDTRGRRMVIDIDFLEGLPSPLRDLWASVRVERVDEGRSRLVLSMEYGVAWGPIGTLMDPLIEAQYRKVFRDMLHAARIRAETGGTVAPIAMPGSGRRLAS